MRAWSEAVWAHSKWAQCLLQGQWLLIACFLASCASSSNPDGSEDGGADAAQPVLVFPAGRAKMSCQFDAQPLGVVPLLVVEPEASLPQLGTVRNVRSEEARGSVLIVSEGGKVFRWAPQEQTPSLVLDLGGVTVFDVATDAQGYLFVLRATANGVEVVRFTANETGYDRDSRTFVMSAKSQQGALTFDAEGYLLIGLGDVTEDARLSIDATDPNTREGVINRIDIRSLGSGSYAIPEDNPNYGAVTETYATGVRAPFACDRAQDGELWCADRGSSIDELHRLDAGRNLGWPTYDGRVCARDPDCDLQLDLYPQVVEERTSDACGMTPGAFWYSANNARKSGTYVFVNTCTSRVHGLVVNAPDRISWNGPVAEAPANIVAVARASDGTPFLFSAQGEVYRVRLKYEAAFPANLSETGCFDDLEALTGAAGLVPYGVNAELWTDGADKQRHFELPVGSKLEPLPTQWRFPDGSVVLKTFSYPPFEGAAPRPVETRVMIKRPYTWEFHSYRWNQAGTEAVLLDNGETLELTAHFETGPVDVKHTFPSRNTCLTCHGRTGEQTIGLRSDQLQGDYTYAGGRGNQLDALAGAGLLDAELAGTVAAMPNPHDESAPTEQRARAYLHTNCAHCHRPGGWVPSNLTMDLRFDTPLADAEICDVPTSFGFGEGYRIRPGEPESSRIVGRMDRRDFDQMPPLATSIVDELGVQTVRAWVASLSACPE